MPDDRMPDPMIQRPVNVPASLWARAQAIKARDGTPVAVLVRIGFEKEVARREARGARQPKA